MAGKKKKSKKSKNKKATKKASKKKTKPKAKAKSKTKKKRKTKTQPKSKPRVKTKALKPVDSGTAPVMAGNVVSINQAIQEIDPARPKRIIVVSDATGETAIQMAKAALVQFEDQDVNFTLYKNVRSKEQIEAICNEAEIHKDLIVFTVVLPEMRALIHSIARDRSIPSVDLLGPLLMGLANLFGAEPESTAGLLHDVNERYFTRIEAMEYTIQHDDGKKLVGLEKADLIILGISRTSKTPLSIYLSHRGWKVCNIPLIRGFDVPEELRRVDQRRVIGLTIDPEDLATIRRARLQRLGQNRGGEYADLDLVNDEIEYANEIFRKNRRWAVFNVTGKAVEETASEIVKLMTSRGLVPPLSNDNIGSTRLSSGSGNVKK